MPNVSDLSLDDIFSLSQLPDAFILIQQGSVPLLENIYYRNLNVEHQSNNFAKSVAIDLVSYERLKFSIVGSDFNLVLNPDEIAGSGKTIIPISFGYSIGISKYLPKFDLANIPLTAEEFIRLVLDVTGASDSQLLFQALCVFENAASDSRIALVSFRTKAMTAYASTNGLAIPDPMDADNAIAFEQIVQAFEMTAMASNSPLELSTAITEIYIEDSNLTRALNKLKKLLALALGDQPLEIFKQLLVPQINVKAYVSLGLEVPRAILQPVIRNTDGTYAVDPDLSKVTTILFAKSILNFNTSGGFGYNVEVEASLTGHPRAQIGNTGLQITFTSAKLDLSEFTNIAEAEADGRPKNFKGFYATEVDVFLPEGWTKQPGSAQLSARNLLVGTGGISGSFGVKAGSSTTLPNGTLIQARLFQDVLVNFNAFEITFSHNKVVSSAVNGTFSINNFRLTDGAPAIFNFNLIFSDAGYKLLFSSSTQPIIVKLGTIGSIKFFSLSIGYENGDWYLEVIAQVIITNSLPILGKVLPQQVNIRRLLLSTDSGKTALEVQPVWADGTTVSGNLTSGLSISQTLNKVIGDALRVEAMRLALVRDTANNRIKALTTFDASLKLGVGSSFGNPANPTEIPNGFLLRVRNVGFYTEAEFRPTGGDVGPAELTTDFKLPDGVAVSINAGGVKGSGSLAVLENGNRYEASITLGFYDIKAAAYAILLKNLPNGQAGPSLLALISADFRTSPLKLGLGFQLEAVGGLIGLHRTVSVSVLRAGLATGALSNLLFPENPAQNAATVLRSIDQAFPPAAGRHTFGLMARLTWGASNLAALEAGLIIEVPTYRVVLIGILTVNLPDKNGSLVKLRVDFLGSIDFGAKKVSFDAILVKSSVRDLPLNGSFAFRLYQGDNPVFIMAAGGFHPAFHPPANADLPTLPRLSLTLSQSDDFRLTLRGYLAVTSNTAQFGSSLDLYAKVFKFLGNVFYVTGFLSFDALFQFNPFWLSVQFEARVTVKKGNTSILSVSLRLALTGPAPWHVSGEASFNFLGKHTARIDRTFGGSVAQPALPSVNVRQLLLAALSDKVNWEIQQPPLKPGNTVVLRVEDQPSELVVDPGGALVVRQKVAPLDYLIQLFNNAQPVNGDQFRVSSVEVGENTNLLSLQLSALGDVRDAFAPGQFRRMSNAEKLSAPSFQFMRSGLRLNTIDGLTGIGGQTRTLAFEQRVLTANTGGTTGNRAAADSTDGTTAQNSEAQGSTTTQNTTTTPDPVLTGEPAFAGWTSNSIEQGIALPADKITQLSRTGAVGRSSRSYEQKRPSRLAPDRVSWSSDSYAIVSTRDLQLDELAQIPFPTEAEATAFLVQRLADDPELVGELQVLPVYQLDVSTPSTSANLVTA